MPVSYSALPNKLHRFTRPKKSGSAVPLCIILQCRLDYCVALPEFVILLHALCSADIEQMVFVDVRKRELLEARFLNEKVRLF